MMRISFLKVLHEGLGLENIIVFGINMHIANAIIKLIGTIFILGSSSGGSKKDSGKDSKEGDSDSDSNEDPEKKKM